MALNVCAACTTAFAVGLPCCPHCRSTDFAEQGQDMPKITVSGGPTNARAEAVLTGGVRMTGEWEPAEAPPIVEDLGEPDEQAEGSEQPSAGSSSQTSSETPPSVPEPSETDHPKPAPATASRSKRARTGSSTARGTASSGPETATSPDPGDE